MSYSHSLKCHWPTGSTWKVRLVNSASFNFNFFSVIHFKNYIWIFNFVWLHADFKWILTGNSCRSFQKVIFSESTFTKCDVLSKIIRIEKKITPHDPPVKLDDCIGYKSQLRTRNMHLQSQNYRFCVNSYEEVAGQTHSSFRYSAGVVRFISDPLNKYSIFLVFLIG